MRECTANDKLILRPVGAEDRDTYLAMANAFYHSPAVLHSIPQSYLERTFDEMVRSNPYVEGLLLENPAGDCMGYVLLAKTYAQEAGGQAIWIDELYVLPEYQGQGIGTQVFEQLWQRFPDCRRFRLEVEPDNEGAIRLYKRMGFVDLPYGQLVRDLGE